MADDPFMLKAISDLQNELPFPLHRAISMEQFEFHPSTTNPLTNSPREWIEIEPNIHQMTLNENTSTGRKSVLQRWQPNTHNVQQNFVHNYVEEIYIVEGDLADTKRGGKWEKGAYAYRKPGMEHGPFYSEKGCLMFIVIIPEKPQA